ncbi:MAG: hypothetical protein Q8L84_03050 [Hyphomonas sp.]|nr:hypothetical protein [Hyphomonas sp.]
MLSPADFDLLFGAQTQPALARINAPVRTPKQLASSNSKKASAPDRRPGKR